MSHNVEVNQRAISMDLYLCYVRSKLRFLPRIEAFSDVYVKTTEPRFGFGRTFIVSFFLKWIESSKDLSFD